MKILTTPDPFLRKKAKPVKELDPQTLNQVQNMLNTLKSTSNPEGLGLAATQVGIDKHLFILVLNQKPHIFINSQIKNQSSKMLTDHYSDPQDLPLEGCLSLPKVWGFVDRPYQVTLTYQTFDQTSSNPKLVDKTQTFTDLNSSYVQHENDHLNGVLFTDHILNQNGTIYKQTSQGLTPLSHLT